MAIAMMKIDKLNRISSKGSSFIGYLNYMDRANGTDEVYMQRFNYNHINDGSEEELMYTCTYTPNGKVEDRMKQAELWQNLGLIEAEKNASIGHYGFVCLPVEATKKELKQITDEFAKKITDEGLTCKLAIHYKKGNPHLHYVIAERELSQEGEWQKTKRKTVNADLEKNNSFNLKSSADPKELSELEAFYTRYFKELGVDVDVDTNKINNKTVNVTITPRHKLTNEQKAYKIPEYDLKTKSQKVRVREGKGSEKLFVRINKDQNIAQTSQFYEFLRHSFQEAHNQVMKDHTIDMRSYKRQGLQKEGGIHSQEQYQKNRRYAQKGLEAPKYRFNVQRYNERIYRHNKTREQAKKDYRQAKRDYKKTETKYNRVSEENDYTKYINNFVENYQKFKEAHKNEYFLMAQGGFNGALGILESIMPKTDETRALMRFIRLATELFRALDFLERPKEFVRPSERLYKAFLQEQKALDFETQKDIKAMKDAFSDKFETLTKAQKSEYYRLYRENSPYFTSLYDLARLKKEQLQGVSLDRSRIFFDVQAKKLELLRQATREQPKKKKKPQNTRAQSDFETSRSTDIPKESFKSHTEAVRQPTNSDMHELKDFLQAKYEESLDLGRVPQGLTRDQHINLNIVPEINAKLVSLGFPQVETIKQVKAVLDRANGLVKQTTKSRDEPSR